MDKLKSLVRVEENFAKLPSVGKKSAERMAYALLDMPKEDVEEFYKSIKEMSEKIHICPICGFLSESEVCPICGDNTRDQSTLVVVSYPKDVLAFEKALFDMTDSQIIDEVTKSALRGRGGGGRYR